MSFLIETLNNLLSSLEENKQTADYRRAQNTERRRVDKIFHDDYVNAAKFFTGPYSHPELFDSREEYDAADAEYSKRRDDFFKMWRYRYEKNGPFRTQRAEKEEKYRRIVNPTPEEQEEDRLLFSNYSETSANLYKDYNRRLEAFKARKNAEKRAIERDKKQKEIDDYNAMSPAEKRKADYAKEFQADPVKAASTPYRQAKLHDPNISSSNWGGTMATVVAPRSKGYGPD